MPTVTSDDDLDAAVVPLPSADGDSGTEALFPEAEYRRRFRRARLVACVGLVVIVAGGLILGVAGRGSKGSAAPLTTASAGGAGVPKGEPSSEVVTRASSFNSVEDGISEVIATTLGSKPSVRIWTYAGGLRNTIINGVPYLANAAHKARVCTPHCSYISTPWLKVVTPGYDRVEPAYAGPNSAVMYDPLLASQVVQKASGKSFTKVGAIQLDGVETTEYRGSVTPMGAQSIKSTGRIGGVYVTLMNAFPQWSYPVPGENPAAATVRVWVDRSGLTRKLEVSWTSRPVQVNESKGRPAITTRVTEHRKIDLTFGQFGKPVPLTAPKPKLVTDVREGTAHESCRIYDTNGGFWSC